MRINKACAVSSGYARPALFFVGLLLLGLFTSADYGLPCDEPAEQVILRENLMEYAIQFEGEESEAASYYDALGTVRISQSIERDHGQAAYYLAAPLLLLAPDQRTTLWHLYTWLWFMAGVLAIYGFGREMGWSRPISCATSLLLYLAPRFFAEGHYNNKDVVLLCLVLLTLWLGLRFLKSPSFLRGLLFSFTGAMATNTKIVGVLPWGLVGLSALVLITARRGWNRRMLWIALSTVFGFALFYALLTPAMWPNPLEYFDHVLQNASGFTRWTGVVVFRGEVYDQAVTPLPRDYLPYMIAVTLPLYTLPLAVAGQLATMKLITQAFAEKKGALLRDERLLILLALTLCWVLPLGYSAIARPLVYNGWRHFYFLYAGIVLLAGQGIAWLSQKLSRMKTPWGKRVGAAVLGLGFAVSAIGLALNHPYQYGYYNLLARKTAGTAMELDYWDVSTVNAMKRLLESTERDTLLPLSLGSRDEMSYFGVYHGYAVLPEEAQKQLNIQQDENLPYLFYNTTYALIYGVPPPDGYHVLFTLESYGNVICTMYERDGEGN